MILSWAEKLKYYGTYFITFHFHKETNKVVHRNIPPHGTRICSMALTPIAKNQNRPYICKKDMSK